MENKNWNSTLALSTNPDLTSLVTPYNLPKTINFLMKANQKLLLGAVAIENLRSKIPPSNFSGSLLVFKSTEFEGLKLISKQQVEFKANVPPSRNKFFELSTPLTIEANCEYKLRFIFDSSWIPRNFYSLTKHADYCSNLDESTKITISPETMNGKTIENELPIILFFNRM